MALGSHNADRPATGAPQFGGRMVVDGLGRAGSNVEFKIPSTVSLVWPSVAGEASAIVKPVT